MTPPVRVVGAAIVEGGRVFAARRSATMREPLAWELPGGKVEDGEAPEEALRRELAEELDVAVEVGAWIGRGTAGGDPRPRLVLDVYEARLLAGPPRLLEHAEGRWLGADELATVEWAEADRPILAALRRRLLAVPPSGER